VAFERMKRITLVILLFGISFMLSFGQEVEQEVIDSIFIHSDSPSEFRLKMLENCENANFIAKQDIEKNQIKLFIVGGIAPVFCLTDPDFEKKYQVSYHDYGDLPAKEDCMYNYNSRVFEYLSKKYGKSWKKEIREDVFGLKEWNRKN